ncbi:MAG: hypothetical protein PF517_11050 [Salinivirgaceae bacterium]|jgi:hypothetical protein|nr:hypothetical protein [Salinivirgaceae bacterium]
MINKWTAIFFIALAFFSCKEQELKQHPVSYDFGYFPLEPGMWKHFEVTHIDIDSASNKYDTLRYELREVFSDWFLDAVNDSTLRIERFMRDSSNHAWQPVGVWQAKIKGNDALMVEENIPYLKIKFPAEIDQNWNGDIFNRKDTLDQYRYTITFVDEPLVIGNLSFDSVLTVTQKNFVSAIDKLDFFEKYAYGVGLIMKTAVDIYSEETDDLSIPVEQRVTQGTLYYQNIIDYGRN